MNKSFPVLLFPVCLTALLLPCRSQAVITINIHPDSNQHAVFETAGQFDGPVTEDMPTGLSSFAIAVTQMFRGTPYLNYNFSAPLATIVDVTRGGSSDIAVFEVSPGYYSYLGFAFGVSLPMFSGDVLSLVSHGPQTLLPYSYVSFNDFVPGDYTFANPYIGAAFQVHVVPEPSVLAMFGAGLVAWTSLRRTGRRRAGAFPGEAAAMKRFYI